MKEDKLLDLEAICKEHKQEELSDEELAKVAGGMNLNRKGNSFAVKCLACNEIVSNWYTSDALPRNTVILMKTARIACPLCAAKGNFDVTNDVDAKELHKL